MAELVRANIRFLEISFKSYGDFRMQLKGIVHSLCNGFMTRKLSAVNRPFN